jgi:hypothetical protein
MGVTSWVGTVYHSGAPEFTPRFKWGSCYSIFSFTFCRLLCVLLYFFFWSLCCLSFNIRILNTSLVSSNSSVIRYIWLSGMQPKKRLIDLLEKMKCKQTFNTLNFTPMFGGICVTYLLVTFCVMLCLCVLFVFVLCLVWLILPASVSELSFLIVPSVFSNIYLSRQCIYILLIVPAPRRIKLKHKNL